MTINFKALAAGIGCGILITAAVAGSLLGASTQNRAIVAAQPNPTITKYLPGATITKTITPPAKVITKTAPPKIITKTRTITRTPKVLICGAGRTEDSCYPDYIGKGQWVLRPGERPTPKVAGGKKATGHAKKVPGATIAGVCRNPRITKGMVADCNKLARRPKVIDAQGNETPNGKVLIRECLDSYLNPTELAICLAPPSN